MSEKQLELWPDNTSIKALVFDFDKTITARHTRGAIFQLAQMEDSRIENNFSDLNFFRELISGVCKVNPDVKFCIATFADDEEESLCSGVALVRKYLEVAFPEKSKTYFPDNQIQAWNPENQSMDPRKVGKNIHLENLRKCLHLKKKEMVLIDDSDRNCILARKSGYYAVMIDEPEIDDDDQGIIQSAKGGLCREAWESIIIINGTIKYNFPQLLNVRTCLLQQLPLQTGQPQTFTSPSQPPPLLTLLMTQHNSSIDIYGYYN
eukprot:gene1979-5059_t